MKAGTILIADDSENDVFALKHVFIRGRILNPLRVVSNGEAAISYLKGEGAFSDRTEFPYPLLLILDLRMPRKSGADVLRWIGEQTNLHPFVTVATTDELNISEMNEAYRLGAHSFLTKPLIYEDFTNLINGVKGIRICPANEGYFLEFAELERSPKRLRL